MDAVVNGALEEICSQQANGLTLRSLWPKINSYLSSNGLHPCTNVKRALWSNLLNIPGLNFECKGVSFDAEDPKIQSFEDCEAMGLKIVAAEHLRNSFLGIYDIKASDSGISLPQQQVLERLAIARTDGATQNDLAKELGIQHRNFFYILTSLESRRLITRQSTLIRKKEAGNEGEHKNVSIVNTNMIHLYRYAKHLGRLQRIEIIKEDKGFTDNDNAEREIATRDTIEDDVHIQDHAPAAKAICDLLEKADGKVLVVSDIKKELGYCKTSGHRAWRRILKKLRDDHVVEEFCATVNKKEVSCLRLLKIFPSKTFGPKSHGNGDDDDLDTEVTEQVNLVKRGKITDQLLELSIDQQIYDMIDAEGSKGLTLDEVYKRLGISSKRYNRQIHRMVSRFKMHLELEVLNKGKVHRVWTSGNFNTEVSNTLPGKLKDTIAKKSSTDAQAGQLMLAHTIEETDYQTSKVDAEASEEQNINLIDYTPLDSIHSHNMQCKANGIVPDAERQTINLKPASDVSSEKSSFASPASRGWHSTTHPCLGQNSVSSQREQLILEKLQGEKVLLKPELLRFLHSFNNLEKKHTMIDKRTLERSLNKLQEDGLCKCISYAVPAFTNCGHMRKIDVILHPSEYKAEDLSDRVHEKLKLFERQIRNPSSFRNKSSNCNSIPVLTNVERICMPAKKDNQAETYEAMRNNGFVFAKMIRAKLLHIFLWGYLTGSPGWDDVISGKHGFEKNNPHSTCKLFELHAAIKAMPLELFLQVLGSSVKLESMIEKCRNGLCLSDLPIQEYKCLMETQTTASLSRLIDILIRLKLIRLIGGELVDAPVGPHTTLRHSLELKPYIEEPVGMVLPSTGVNSFDLRPHVRHDFILASRKGVDEYWNTLEYCYAASDPKAALHAFPGSAVHEVFRYRTWASNRVMTADQRAELFKLVANEDPDTKLSYKKCEKIAENLNLTLEQVLSVFYDHRRKQKVKAAARVKGQKTRASLSYKRKRSLEGKLVNDEKTLLENPLDDEPGELKHAKILSTDDAPFLEDHETHMMIDEMDGQKEALDDLELNEDEDTQSYPAIHDPPLSKLQSARQKKFSWTENKDRLLVIEYVRHRAALGAKFHRTDWASLQSLPAPPDTCRRRISTLNRNNQFRKAVLRLCNMLSVRYMKHLESSKNKSLDDNCRMIIHDQEINHDAYRNASDLIDNTKDLEIEEQWDDFDNNDIKIALDEVLQYKQVAKLETNKGARHISSYPRSDVGAGGLEFDETILVASATPSNELKDGRRRQASTRRSKHHLPRSYVMLMDGGNDFGTQAYKSLAVSNAIELFKLIFLSTAKSPEVPNLLAETLRRYSEHDLFTAFNYLRERNFMVRGSGISQFVLSQQFLHNLSSSPFPVNSGKRAVKMTRWLHEIENDILDNGVDLSADLECGDVLQLCVLVSSGEVSMFPCMPDEGLGEIEDLRKRKGDENEMCSVEIAKKLKLLDSEIFCRKEKGFPGIQLSLSRNNISRVDTITSITDETERGTSCGSTFKQNSWPSGHMEGALCSGDAFLKTNAASESTWEAMTRYAEHLASSAPEPSPLYPNLFKTVYSAIQKAGDQGLSMEGISQIVDALGGKMPELVVEVLEAFGRALKVNAYDSVHVVDSVYRSKYLLASTVSHRHDLDITVPESCTNDGMRLELHQENHEKEGNLLMKETCTDLQVNMDMDTDEVHTSDDMEHRVTILNHPGEVPQPMNENQGNKIETYMKAKVMSPRTDVEKEKCEFLIGDSPSYKQILPWVNGDGTINEIVYKGLVRRVLGIVMQNPGILEEHVLSQITVLNPQSCRTLLELMILDNHIKVRKMYQSVSNEAPKMLHRLLRFTNKKPKLVCREHLFANHSSISFL